MTAYGILSRGLLNRETARLGEGDPRARFPRFQGGNLERNLELLDALEKIAEQRGVSTAQLAIAWVAAQGERHHPADRDQAADPARGGARRPRPAADPDELAAIEAAVPAGQVAGTRYDAAQMGALDSDGASARAPACRMLRCSWRA